MTPAGHHLGRVRSRAAAQAILGAGCVSFSAIWITLANTAPATAAFYRCIFPLPVLGALAIAERRRNGPRSLASRGYAVLAGLFLALNLVLWIQAIDDVGAGPGTVLGNLQVLFVVACAWAVLHERPDRRFFAALPAVLIGVVLVSGWAGGGSTGRHPVAGLIAGLATSAAYAGCLLILRQAAGQGLHPVGQVFDATAAAAVGALLLGLAFGGLRLAIGWQSLRWLLVLSLSGGILGWLFITASLPRLPASVSSLLLMLEPAGAMVFAAIILHQQPSLLQITGAVLICGGVLAVASKA